MGQGMKDKMTCVEYEVPADGNIFLDLGFPPDEAARLLAEADRQIDESRAAKEKRKMETSRIKKQEKIK